MGRLLLFGIDAATMELIRPWAARGDLPALGRLIRDGASGVLTSVPNMITPAAWTSFATGTNPGQHGIFYFTQRAPDSYDEQFVRGGGRARAPFWMLTSEAGVPSTVLNVPMTFPADPLLGTMVSGMDAPDLGAPGFTHPPELAEELRQRFGSLLEARSLSGAIGHLMLAGRTDEAKDVLVRNVRARTDLARYLMDRRPAELFVLVHTEVDGAQHYFWRYMDGSTPGPRDTGRRHQDAILRLYQEVDRSLEALMHSFGPEAVMVISDHGAGVSPGPEDGVPWIRLVLEHSGLAARRSPPDPLRRYSTQAMAALYRAVNPRLPQRLRRSVRRWVPGAREAARSALRYRYDWARTRAFCLGAPGDVWLNVRGRDPQGTVEPGAEYERLRRSIRDLFLGLRDSRTGEPVVEAVLLREDVYSGPFVERAPDLFIRFTDAVINGIVSNGTVLRLPRRTAAVPKDVKSGSHRPDGTLVMAGTGVRAGADLHGATLLDVAPTLLYWLGLPVPTYMDGRVLTRAFEDDYLRTHPMATSELHAGVGRAAEDGYTDAETQVVAERLRNLGYV